MVRKTTKKTQNDWSADKAAIIAFCEGRADIKEMDKALKARKDELSTALHSHRKAVDPDEKLAVIEFFRAEVDSTIPEKRDEYKAHRVYQGLDYLWTLPNRRSAQDAKLSAKERFRKDAGISDSDSTKDARAKLVKGLIERIPDLTKPEFLAVEAYRLERYLTKDQKEAAEAAYETAKSTIAGDKGKEAKVA